MWTSVLSLDPQHLRNLKVSVAGCADIMISYSNFLMHYSVFVFGKHRCIINDTAFSTQFPGCGLCAGWLAQLKGRQKITDPLLML